MEGKVAKQNFELRRCKHIDSFRCYRPNYGYHYCS